MLRRKQCFTLLTNTHTHTHTHTRLTALRPGLPRWAGTRKVKPIWILLKQETVSGSGISWAICKSAHPSRQITTPAPHHSVFYRPVALPAGQPTVSKHWRNLLASVLTYKYIPCNSGDHKLRGCGYRGQIFWFPRWWPAKTALCRQCCN